MQWYENLCTFIFFKKKVLIEFSYYSKQKIANNLFFIFLRRELLEMTRYIAKYHAFHYVKLPRKLVLR